MASMILDKELYIVGYDVYGVKTAHFMGYPYQADGKYLSVEYTGVEVPIDEVKRDFNDGSLQDCADMHNQYVTEHSSEEEQTKYWLGDDFKGELELSEVTIETPCGTYCCSSLRKLD